MSSPVPGDRPIVLVVEDEPRMARLIRYALEPAGFDIVPAADAAEALEQLEAEHANLILLDVVMPGMDGLQLCRRIREMSDVPIVMLTARGDEADRVQGLNLGAGDYVVKPFSPVELVARVRAILRRTHGADSRQVEPYDDGTLRIDFARRQVWREGCERRLSRVEFRLLLVLAREPGRVIPHGELMARVWGTDYGASNAQVRTYVKYLRRKIERDPRAPRYILNQPGVGYLFHLPDPPGLAPARG